MNLMQFVPLMFSLKIVVGLNLAVLNPCACKYMCVYPLSDTRVAACMYDMQQCCTPVFVLDVVFLTPCFVCVLPPLPPDVVSRADVEVPSRVRQRIQEGELLRGRED